MHFSLFLNKKALPREELVPLSSNKKGVIYKLLILLSISNFIIAKEYSSVKQNFQNNYKLNKNFTRQKLNILLKISTEVSLFLTLSKI